MRQGTYTKVTVDATGKVVSGDFLTSADVPSGGGSAGVTSFNGRTGAVTGVDSVNGTTGAVTNIATTSGTLAQFASTTSAQLATVLSDETGTGVAVFNANPTIGSASVSTPALIVQAATSQISGDIMRVTDSTGAIYTNFYIGGFAVSASDFSSVLILDGTGMSLQNSLPLTVGNTVLDAFGRVKYSATGLLKIGDNITTGGGIQVGTAASATTINGTTSVVGNTTVTGTLQSSSKFGYQTDGGNATQLTSITTTVTLNQLCGTITLFSGARASQTNVVFTFTNSTIAANDIIVFSHVSGGTIGAYTINATAAAGSASVTIRNVNTASLTEAPVFRFIVVKA